MTTGLGDKKNKVVDNATVDSNSSIGISIRNIDFYTDTEGAIGDVFDGCWRYEP